MGALLIGVGVVGIVGSAIALRTANWCGRAAVVVGLALLASVLVAAN